MDKQNVMRDEFAKAADAAGITQGADRLALYAWWLKAWQASRAAVVVELPTCEYANAASEYSKGHRQGIRACREAIEAAGMKAGAKAAPKVCECPTGVRNITDGGHFPACTACKRRLK